MAALAVGAARRVHEGDMDHLVFYVLQSTHFTSLPPMEPALVAREFGDSSGSGPPANGVLPSVEPRVDAFLKAMRSNDRDSRLAYFRAMLESTPPRDRKRVVGEQFTRAMLFLYRKEFLTRAQAGQERERMYQSRGLSTDTAVEAGYGVYSGLGVLKGLDPSLRIRRVLLVGPGMDLAPRTGMLEEGPPESYQPWAVIDALFALGLSAPGELEVVAADLNPRVVQHLRSSARRPPVLRLVGGLKEDGTLQLTPGYRDYFAELGHRIGSVQRAPAGPAGHLSKEVRVDAGTGAALLAVELNVVTDRVTERPFDLVIATNVLVYFERVELQLALANISAVLAPGGVLLHNESRSGIEDDARLSGLVLEQARQVVIATVAGALPLADRVFLHRKR